MGAALGAAELPVGADPGSTCIAVAAARSFGTAPHALVSVLARMRSGAAEACWARRVADATALAAPTAVADLCVAARVAVGDADVPAAVAACAVVTSLAAASRTRCPAFGAHAGRRRPVAV